MNLRSFFVVAALSLSTGAIAHDHHAGSVEIGPSYARSSLPGQGNGAAYLSLQNKSADADALVAVSTPVAKEVEMHTMAMQDKVMRMRQVEQIELPAGATVAMQPGSGYHLMLMGLKAPLKTGDSIPLVLQFRHAGKIETTVPVRDSLNGMTMNKH